MAYTKKPLAAAILLTQSIVTVPLANAQLEEVVVTAERREADLQETDISMTVMSSDTLIERGVSTYADVGNFAPNVMIHEQPGKAGAAIAIRGFKNAETVATFEPKVALYLDGVLIAKNAGSAFDVVDLERIEILRGPQGTLYGRNTVGGAVNVITKKPYDELGGKLTVTLGDFNQQDIKGTINVPITDTLATKLTLATLNRDGYWDNDFLGNDIAEKDRQMGHFQLQWRPSDQLSVLYSYDKTKIDETPWLVTLLDNNDTFAPQLAPYVTDGTESTRNTEVNTFMEAEVEGHSVTVDWDINDSLTLVSISAFREMENENLNDSEGSILSWFNQSAGDETETFTQEFRLVGSAFDNDLEYVTGIFYMDEDVKESFAISLFGTDFFVSSRQGLASGPVASAENEIWAVFGEATYAITSKLDLTFGLRYTDEDRQMSRTDVTVLPSGTVIESELPDASGTFDDVSGTFSLTYQWTDDLMTYAKVSKGYVSGGFNARSPSPDTFQQGYEEETVWTYELGWKTTWFDRKLLFNGAAFFNDYEDLQVNLLDDETARNNIGNAGEATIQGFEVELNANPIESLDLGLGYGYLDTDYDTYIDPVSGADLSENKWAHSPKHSINSWIRYAIPLLQDIGELSARIDWSYRSDHYLLTSLGNYVDEYDFFDGRITLDNIKGPGDTQFRVALWGKNLTDETWYTSGYNLVDNLGFRAAATNAPRTYGIDAEIRF